MNILRILSSSKLALERVVELRIRIPREGIVEVGILVKDVGEARRLQKLIGIGHSGYLSQTITI